MERHLHIVSFNVPYPADYGGVIDVFYRIKALAEAGVKVHLHCYSYGRPPAPELEQLCHTVYYYRRDTSPLRLLDKRPYIVASRSNDDLCRTLLLDDYPILLEGVHCCDVLERKEFDGRKVMVRAHNVEADYYRMLSIAEHSLLRKCYLRSETRKLRRYESILARAAVVFAISQQDARSFEAVGMHNVQVVSASHPFDKVVALTGRGDYALFHGNLSVPENYRAVEFLAENLFADGQIPFVVAGNHPPQWLRTKLSGYRNVTLVDSPDEAAMQRLVREAQVILLRTDQPTGMKLKLLHSLFAGRHCLVNSDMVVGTSLAPLCTVADDVSSLRKALERLMATDFDASMLNRRADTLAALVPAAVNQKIIDQL